MSDPLRDLMERLADEQPAVPVDPSLYSRGRRAHRRGLALRTGVAAGLVGVAVLVGVPVLDGSRQDPPPAAGEVAPAMPSRLHPVPERLAAHDEGGWSWHPDVRADDLAVGPTAAVFPVNGGALVAVSAVDGSYQGLELPGFDESGWFRFESQAVALSPDGTRLAWTWNPDVISGTGDDEPATGIRIADLASGAVTDVEIESTYGVYAHGFGWSANGRYLAYRLETVTSPDGEVQGSRSYRIGRLDTSTGRTVLTGLPSGVDASPAVSNEGTVAASGGGYNGIWSPDGPAVRTFEGPFDSVSWSPDGRRTAMSSSTRQVAVGDRRGVRQETSLPTEGDGGVRVVGWSSRSTFVLLDEAASRLVGFSAGLEEGELLVRADGVPNLYQLSVATDLLDEPTRDTPAPEWPTDGGTMAWKAALAAVAVLMAIALLVGLRRRT